MNPCGSFGPGMINLAITPAMKPMMIVQMRLISLSSLFEVQPFWPQAAGCRADICGRQHLSAWRAGRRQRSFALKYAGHCELDDQSFES
jgi:hypothetical protein